MRILGTKKLVTILLAFSCSYSPIKTEGNKMTPEDVQKWVNDRVAASKVVVFSGRCPYCIKANGILTEMAPSDVTIFQLDDNPDRPTIMEHFKTTTGAGTVPRVFVGGKFYGDCSKVTATKASGELKKALLDAGCKLDES